MLSVTIPGLGPLNIQYVVSDLNGTLSMNGEINPKLPAKINALKAIGITFYVLSADTRGKLHELATQLGAIPHILTFQGKESTEKAEFIIKLGAENVVAIGNGNNDYLMLKAAKIGIAVLGKEGLSIKALLNSDICVSSPEEALDLLLNPINLLSSLRD
ncbi:MAG: HAD family hydrolase [Promethearchaeota archaeon]|nr:MAG: HAD family hydrolase [Candidatus Lokiarchaeota archaeon]